MTPGTAVPRFNDITDGNNGAYKAGPGWDACTGLGTPDGTALLTRLSSLPQPRHGREAIGAVGHTPSKSGAVGHSPNANGQGTMPSLLQRVDRCQGHL